MRGHNGHNTAWVHPWSSLPTSQPGCAPTCQPSAWYHEDDTNSKDPSYFYKRFLKGCKSLLVKITLV